jgi:hypothetical protein
LQDLFEGAYLALPHSCWSALVRTTLKSIALAYMRLFSPDGVMPG